MKKYLSLLCVILFVCGNLFASQQEWIPLSASPDLIATPSRSLQTNDYPPNAEQPQADNVEVNVISSNDNFIEIEYQLNGFYKKYIEIDGEEYSHPVREFLSTGTQIGLPKESVFLEEGLPELPRINRSIIIPAQAKMVASVVDFEMEEFHNINIVPSKGNLLRSVNPEDVPYTFSDFYTTDSWFPKDIVKTYEPYIMRDARGMVIEVHPFQYNPIKKVLRVYNHIRIDVENVGLDDVNILDVDLYDKMRIDRDFLSIYKRRFINFDRERYDPIEEVGNMLIITYDNFHDDVLPLYEWKLQKGIPTELVDVGTIGNNYTAIKAYIQQKYNNEGVTYILLVGDAAQVQPYGGNQDPKYTQLAGGDSYPDAFIGRLSAENISQVETQVERFITYERDPLIGGDWYHKGTGIASSQGAGQGWNDWADYVMMGIIRDSLLAYTYTEVDQIYDPGAYASQVTTAINDGRSTVNYCGHGSTTSWGTTGFSNSNVNALVNDNMLPFIITVACLNGQFQNTTCFAEAWLRATNSSTGEPTGAIGMYASTIGQPWEPPMPAEYEANMLLVHEEKNTYGGLCFNGSMFMMDVCPIEGPDVFEHWTLFGDPSLQVRTDIPTQMTVEHNPIILIGSTTYDVEVVGVQGALVGLYMNDLLYGYGYTDENGYVTVELIEDLFEPGVMTITVTAYNKIPYITTIDVIGSGYFDISGNVGYYSNADPVQNTSVTLTESGTYSTTTTTNGDYLFNDIPSGSYISTPSKADNLGGLSGTDASRIARYAAGLYSFDCLEIIAGDVSMNGYISGMDASRVARYIAGLITELNDDGIEWVFTPEPIPECNYWPPIVYENTREYSPLNLDLTEEDFIGIRLGDVSGNWSPDSRVVLTSESFEAIELDININSILKIPIVIENITDIEGIDIEIAFNPEVLQLTGLSLNEGILNNKDYGVETNLEEPGQGTMVIYALRDLVSESGVVAFIEFDVIGDEGSSSEIYFTKFDVNETEASGGFQIGDSEGNEVVTRRLEVNVVQALPDKFALYQNYPNPFSRTTLIRYDLPQDTYVNIQIYNVRGQLVKELVNGVETAGRKHIEWDTEGMSSGIYFYRLSTKDKTFIKKMVLMR